MERKTPLYENHVACGGKIVPFAGYLLPVQYGSGVIAEHMAVREKAGLFDVSHMGELFLSGPDALQNLQNLMTNDFSDMNPGQVRYSTMCYENGGTVDDVIVYKYANDRWMMVVNAANHQKDVAWIRQNLTGDCTLEDLSEQTALMALQGPVAQRILEQICDPAGLPQKYYTFVEKLQVGGVDCMVSQTGYTGEHGYELYVSTADAPALWDLLLQTGKAHGLIPCGLGARDTLRLESGMPLYGHELSENITPLEAGLRFAVKLKKEGFIGKAALEAAPPGRKRIGLRMTGRGIARENAPVLADGKQVGITTSGTHCPWLGEAVAMAMVDASFDTGSVEVEVRGRTIPAEVVPMPFYKRA